MSAEKPVQGFPVDAPQTSDEFESEQIGPQWQWNHNPRNERWSLSEHPGHLRLYASSPVGEGGFWKAPNTLSQRIMGKGEGQVTAKINIEGMVAGQFAGLCRFSGQYVLLGIKANEAGEKQLIFQHNQDVITGPFLTANTVYLRSNNVGRDAYFSYGTDGKNWERFGPDFLLTFGRWRGDRLGFFCWNENNDEKKGFIDIDWFHYDAYDGPRP
jgi:beta-xylosidase